MTDVFTLDPAVILDFALKVGLATLAGVFIGLEREYKGKSAGLKTNTLVSLGACTFVLISLDFQGGENVDVTRVLGQVVTGIGFWVPGSSCRSRTRSRDFPPRQRFGAAPGPVVWPPPPN